MAIVRDARTKLRIVPVYMTKLSWLGQTLTGLSVEDQLKFSTFDVEGNRLYDQYWEFINSKKGMGAGQMDYRYDLKEYPNKTKKFFLPVSSNRKIPTQNLNIQTSTFKTNHKVFVETYGAIRGPDAFEEF